MENNETVEEKEFSVSYMYANVYKKFDDPDSSLKGYASLTYSNCMTINGIKIIEGKNGMFVSMPQQQAYDSELKSGKIDEEGHPVYEDIVFPTSKEARESVTKCVLDAYNNENGYAYVSANKETPRNTAMKATMYERNGESIKAAGFLSVGDFKIKNVSVAVREKKDDGEKFLSVNYPSYSYEKDGEKKYNNYVELKEKGNRYDFDKKKEVESNFKRMANSIVIKAAKETQPELNDIIKKEAAQEQQPNKLVVKPQQK